MKKTIKAKNLDINDDELKTNLNILEDEKVSESKKTKLKEYDLYSDMKESNEKKETKKKNGEFDMKKKKKQKPNTLKDKILIVLMMGLIGIFSIVVLFCLYIIITAPNVSEKKLYKNNSTVLLDKDGNEFKRLGTENRQKVTYDELPEVLIDAIIATEDSRFFQHDGVDFARFAKAAFGQLIGQRGAGGGSTLTMQVSKNVATSSVSSGLAGIVRKFTDIYVSIFKLEKKYTKEQIMEFYVNIPNLGAGAFGVEQASQTYFGKSVTELNLTEAALIAGLFQAPSAYNPYAYPERAEQRRNIVLNLMYKHGYINESERDAAKAVPVTSLLTVRNNSLSEHLGFIDTVVEEVVKRTKDDPYEVSMIIHTTLDPKRQKVVNDINNGVTFKWKNDVAQAGIAVISVKDGSIVAVGAGRNKKTERSFNYATSARRHPGSTAKPVLDYGPAIEYLDWGTGQLIIDDNYRYSSGGKIKNFDNGHKGVMTIKKALAQSRNIPALIAFQQTTNEQKVEFATNLGWKPEMPNGTILESCSIGGFEGVTPVEAAAAYATFARGGTYIEPHSFTKIEYQDRDEIYEPKLKKVQAMSDETAYEINMILKYAVTSGHIGAGSVSGTDIAAKTGTSTVDPKVKKEKGIKGSIIGDSWEIAYSPDYAIATWYGYPKITKDYYLTGSEGGRARREITKKLTTKIFKKRSRFKRPSGIRTATIELETDPVELASEFTPDNLKSTEYFKKGAMPRSTSNRFARLEDPSNLNITSSGIGYNITWNAAKIPDAINTEYLTEYFNSSKMYKKWADKYLGKRLKYNQKTLGEFGYNVIVTTPAGVTSTLGFTKNTNFQIVTPLENGSKITVKTSYSKFTANQSVGISSTIGDTQAVITPEIPTPATEVNTQIQTTLSHEFTIEYVGPLCSTVNDFNNLGGRPKDKLKITSNGTSVTDQANISYDCSKDGVDVSCNSLTNGQTYDILFTVKYNGITKNKQITLKPTC